MNSYCETCEGEGTEFCAGPCGDCGLTLHCNKDGRCEDCQDNADETAWERAQERARNGTGRTVQEEYVYAWQVKRRLR